MSSGEGDGLVPGGTGSLPDAWGACLSFVTWYQKLGALGYKESGLGLRMGCYSKPFRGIYIDEEYVVRFWSQSI